MAVALNLNSKSTYRCANRQFQLLIKPAEEHFWIVTATPMNSDHMLAQRQKLQTTRLIESMARQMQRGVVAGWPNSFEQVKIEVITGDATCDV